MTKAIVDIESFIYRGAAATTDLLELEEGLFTQVYILQNGLDYIQGVLEDIVNATGANEYTFVFGGKNNYRKVLNPNYKANRKDNKPHPMLYKLRDKVQEIYPCCFIEWLEADDTCRILFEENKFENVLVSIDKDLRTFPCRVYNPDQRDLGVQRVTKQQADYNFFKQLLTGDKCDGYDGLKGVGPQTADKLLVDVKTLEDVKNIYEGKGSGVDFISVYNMAHILGKDSIKDNKIKLYGNMEFDIEAGEVCNGL
jgi:DNA polymerase-1